MRITKSYRPWLKRRVKSLGDKNILSRVSLIKKLIKDGPYFKRHFTSTFGSVVHVAFITNSLLAVIGSKGIVGECGEMYNIRIMGYSNG